MSLASVDISPHHCKGHPGKITVGSDAPCALTTEHRKPRRHIFTDGGIVTHGGIIFRSSPEYRCVPIDC